jgi:hypothetical protein
MFGWEPRELLGGEREVEGKKRDEGMMSTGAGRGWQRRQEGEGDGRERKKKGE